MSASPIPTPQELLPKIAAALKAVEDLPPEQQQVVLEAASATARAVVDLRSRLYMQGTIVNSLGRK